MDQQVLIRADGAEVARWDAAAARLELSRSAWIRRALRLQADREATYKPLPPLELEQTACVVAEWTP